MVSFLSVYSDSGLTNPVSEFSINDIVYIDGKVTLDASASADVTVEIFDNLDVLQTTALSTTHAFPSNNVQDLKTDIASGSNILWDTTGATIGEYYVKVCISGSGVEPTSDFERFKLSSTINNPVISNTSTGGTNFELVDTITFSCDISNMTSTDEAWVEIINGVGNILYVGRLETTDNATFSKAVPGTSIGTGTGMTVKMYAINAAGKDEVTI